MIKSWGISLGDLTKILSQEVLRIGKLNDDIKLYYKILRRFTLSGLINHKESTYNLIIDT